MMNYCLEFARSMRSNTGWVRWLCQGPTAQNHNSGVARLRVTTMNLEGFIKEKKRQNHVSQMIHHFSYVESNLWGRFWHLFFSFLKIQRGRGKNLSHTNSKFLFYKRKKWFIISRKELHTDTLLIMYPIPFLLFPKMKLWGETGWVFKR